MSISNPTPDKLPPNPKPLTIKEIEKLEASEPTVNLDALRRLKGHNLIVSMNNGKFFVGLLNSVHGETFFVGNSPRLVFSDVKAFRET